jgi:hemerythrin-like domain-containing protein
MTKDLDGPADTTVMGIVHDALRRDLGRLGGAFATGSVDDVQRIALADHIRWMMDFLHQHHSGEDRGLWPLVRAKNPAAGELLDRMDADHATIAPVMSTVVAAATRYRGDPSGEDDVVASLAALSAPLLSHLRREEDEVMPVVSASITDRDWRAWDQKFNVRGKSLPRLAAEGHWLMDGLDPPRYQTLVHLVPAPVRFVVIKGFAGQYRRACARRWGPDVAVGPLPAVTSSAA